MRLEKSGMFTGPEQGGLLASAPTLFVQGCETPWIEVEDALKQTGVRHLELGAGRLLDWDSQVLEQALASPLLDYVTVETASLDHLTDADLAHPKLYIFFVLLMPEAIAASRNHAANPRLIKWFQKNSRVQLKVATDVHLMIMNNNGLLSFNRNDIFVADKPYAS